MAFIASRPLEPLFLHSLSMAHWFELFQAWQVLEKYFCLASNAYYETLPFANTTPPIAHWFLKEASKGQPHAQPCRCGLENTSKTSWGS